MKINLIKGRHLCLPSIKHMPMLSAKSILSLTFIVLICSCSARHREVNALSHSLNYTTPEIVLKKLIKTDPPERDFAQYHLDLGTLHFLNGEFDKAIKNLSEAKKEMAALNAFSISETAASATVNETLASFSGSPTDKVMVYNFLALSYLFTNDINAARVEVLQADVMSKSLADSDSLSGQLASSQLISGIIFELLGEDDDSYISYKHAESILNERGLPINNGLKLALLRQSDALNLSNQHNDYKQKFSDVDYKQASNKQIFMLYLDGVVSTKKQISVTIYDPNDNNAIRIAMPSYASVRYVPTYAKLQTSSEIMTTELVENLEPIVRDDLSDIYPRILATTTARAIVKYNAVQQASKQDSLLGLLVNVATVLTESADLRSWSMLPSNIQFAYIDSDTDSFDFSSPKVDKKNIDIKGKNQTLIVVSSVSKKPFIYTQSE